MTSSPEPLTTAAGRPDTLGVLGGTGPLATVDFLTKLVRLTPATRDADHLPVLVYAVPQVPDRVGPILTGAGPSPLPALRTGVRTLVAGGAKAIALPCHTAHAWAEELATAAAPARLLHIADAALADLARRGFHAATIAVLSTAATGAAQIYQPRLVQAGHRPLAAPADLLADAVLPAIALVKQGELARARPLVEQAVARMLALGADAVLLACTELPTVFGPGELPDRCLDGTEALARACVAWGLSRR